MLQVLRRRRLLVVFTALAVPLAALIFSLTQTEEYTAESSLLFRDAGVDQQLFGSAFFTESSDPEREAATNIRLVSLEEVADRTAAALPRLGLSGSDVSDNIDVSEEGDSDIATIAATDEEPAVASRLANTFAREFIEFRRRADRSTLLRAQALVRAQLDRLPPAASESTEAVQLRRREQELEILASLQTGDVELVQRAKPPGSPSSPKTKRNVALGLVLGLLLGIGVALLREQLDRRLRNPEEAQRAYDLPLLAVIPRTGAMLANRGVSMQRVPSAAAEAFRMLRANLRFFNVDHAVHSVLVTSAAPREGKTTVSWNLALAEAQSGKSVLLIEADLRHPTLAQTHGIEPEGALTLVLAGDQSLDKAITPVLAIPVSSGDSLLKLDVIYAGPPPPNPGELLESRRMHTVLREARGLYDLVVIDTPPTVILADAIPLMQVVDGVIVVARVNDTRRDQAEAMRRQLDRLGAPTLGLVVNGAVLNGDNYYYRS